MVSQQLIEWLNPESTALLVIDIQNGYISADAPFPKYMGFDTTPIEDMIPYLERFIQEFRQYNIPIIWTRMAESRGYAADRIVEKMELDGTPDITTPGTTTFEYHRIKPQKGDIEFEKFDYDAFTNGGLEQYLQEQGIKTLVGSGILTSRCVDTTMRSAHSKKYRWIMAEDLVSVPKQLMHEHEATLSVCRAIIGPVVNSNDITNALSSYEVKK